MTVKQVFQNINRLSIENTPAEPDRLKFYSSDRPLFGSRDNQLELYPFARFRLLQCKQYFRIGKF